MADIASLPAHLGWGSEAVTRNLRAGRQRRQVASDRATALTGEWESQLVVPRCQVAEEVCELSGIDRPQYVKIYPDIALGMLRQEQAAAGLTSQHQVDPGQALRDLESLGYLK